VRRNGGGRDGGRIERHVGEGLVGGYAMTPDGSVGGGVTVQGMRTEARLGVVMCLTLLMLLLLLLLLNMNMAGEGVAIQAPSPSDFAVDVEGFLGPCSRNRIHAELVSLSPALGASTLPFPITL